MNRHQFEEQPPSPRAQRMTEDEAKAVIDLWQQEEIESGGLTTRPAVPDVAEGLDVSIEDVQRLLQKVRTQRQAEEKRLAHDQYELELEQIRLAEEERKLAEFQRQQAEFQRRQAEVRRQHADFEAIPMERLEPRYLRPTRSLPFAHGISPPSTEEMMETTQTESRIKAEERRFGGYVLAAIAAILLLAHTLRYLFP